jgi:hypothetical protein
MAAIDNFSPTAQSVIRMFAGPFHAAATADLVSWFTAERAQGVTASQQLNFLFNLAVPGSPFTAYASTSSDTAFVTALVDNLTSTTGISAGTKAGWVQLLVPEVDSFPTRGDFALYVMDYVAAYAGTDADLLAVKTELVARVETAAAFAQSGPGAVYDGQGWGQLLAPQAPPPEPTYALASSALTADEGTNVTFTLTTTNVAPGTSLPYTLSGNDITAADIAGGLLTGMVTVNAAGVGIVTVTLAADATTEGGETLRMAVGGNLAQRDVVVNDTSTTPLQPTYALAAGATTVNEGGTVQFTLTTTRLAAGTVVNYSLSGITADDLASGTLTGAFVTNDQGLGTITVALKADQLTEGPEVLTVNLSGGLASAQTTVQDTSTTPPPLGSPDTVIIADAMNNANAHAPLTPAEGEIPINTYLSYDLLDQGGVAVRRMTIAELKATQVSAGAPLDATNQSADRGNIPQLSNQTLYVYDLGLQKDRVDYSAESGKIVAAMTSVAPANTLYVLVNDNAVDNAFNGATDRLDTLISVEEVIASKGGGVLDLTDTGRDWLVAFSRSTTVDTATDRALHRIELSDPQTGLQHGTQFFEARDAGGSDSLVATTAAWTGVQGSDRNETLVFTANEALENRVADLRGGTNTVRFSDLSRSILVDVAMVPWVPSTSLADDTNASGRVTATTRFTTGDGATLLSGSTNVSSSHTPDNGIAAGILKITASQDAEDTLSFSASALPKVITLGGSTGGLDTVSARLVGAGTGTALEAKGFEFLHDNGSSDDLYVVENILLATQNGPLLSDGVGNDHDGIKLATEALGSAAVGGVAGTVSLATLTGGAPGFGVDFDVLDLSGISATATGLQVVGTAGTDDELVAGALGSLGAVTAFEALVLTNASVDKGTALTLDLDAGQVRAGNVALFGYTGSVISAGGLAFSSAGQASLVAPSTVGWTLAVVDNAGGAGASVWGGATGDLITGGAGNDTLRGGGGNDTLDGGVPASGSLAETWQFTLAGTPDAVTAAANRIMLTLSVDGTALTLTEAAVADTAYGDGNGAVVDGASTTTIGTAMAALVNANLATINAGPGTGMLAGATYESASGTLRLSFQPGVDANDVVTFVLNSGAGPDGGNFTLSAGVNANGGNGGQDTFVFEKTAAANGADVLLNFTAGSDKLDVSAFAGAPIAAAGAQLNATTGGSFTGVATTAEFIYNKAGGLSAADFATGPAAGKFVLGDGLRSVVAVTADPTGARGDATASPVLLYFVENGAASGLSDLSVSLVGTVSGPQELTLNEVFAALG